MKKFVTFGVLLLLPLIVSGCTSNITAKYDNYDETFTGKTYYDSLTYRATIDVTSEKNNARCLGNAKMFMYPVWQFKLVCSDGRMIIGTLPSGKLEGQAFTNRNETITFSVAKKQGTIQKVKAQYNAQTQNKPTLDNKKEHIQVVMQQ